jgi:hypothetical protein
MAKITSKERRGAFRVPNSLVQGLTTTTRATGLNRLTSFQMVTLFGLMAHVSSKQPQKEVRLKVRDILEIIGVSRNVSHAVERRWTTRSREERRRRYEAVRYHPKHLKVVHDALLALHNTSVALHHFDTKSGRKVKDEIIHILDSFGYVYEVGGRCLDVDDLPADRERVNIGTDDRPVWRVLRRAGAGDRYERPAGVTFRLNKELAQEVLQRKGTVGFTLFAQAVFDLFRQFMRSPAAIRLLVLTLRQTQEEFTRCLAQMLDDLGFDSAHKKRGIDHLKEVLGRLRDREIVTRFEIDEDADRVKVGINRTWYCEGGEGRF